MLCFVYIFSVTIAYCWAILEMELTQYCIQISATHHDCKFVGVAK